MNRKDLIRELRARGYDAVEHDVIKNGVTFEALIVEKDKKGIVPVIYTEHLLAMANRYREGIKEVVDSIVKLYNEHKSPEIAIEQLVNKEYIKQHIFLVLQKAGTAKEGELARPSAELEEVDDGLRISITFNDDSVGNVTITKQLLDVAGITEKDAWEWAQNNTINDAVAYTMKEVLREMIPEDGEAMLNEYPMYIITNQSRFKGAAAVYNKEALKKIAKLHNTDRVVILPSSIHEVIAIPYTGGDVDVQELSEMMQEINDTVLEPCERLSDRAYVIEV